MLKFLEISDIFNIYQGTWDFDMPNHSVAKALTK